MRIKFTMFARKTPCLIALAAFGVVACATVPAQACPTGTTFFKKSRDNYGCRNPKTGDVYACVARNGSCPGHLNLELRERETLPAVL